MKKYLIMSLLVLVPVISLAASETSFIYSGWFPYWKKTTSMSEVTRNLKLLSEVSPFSYEVAPDGRIIDAAKLTSDPWPKLFKAAKSKKTKVIPTVAWFNAEAIHRILSDELTRKKHVADLVAIAKNKNFSGIDIDYENKKVESRAAFSAFVKELATALDGAGKTLSCTIEPRTPIEARFTTPPADIAYVNDYAVFNQYCDEVRIMAYDQGSIDIQLNALKGGKNYYMPVADRDWVKKVIAVTVQTIDPKKIMLGIPTYGYEYEVTPMGRSYTYKRIRSVTYDTARDLAREHKTSLRRNNGGELSFTYQVGTTTRFVVVSDSQAIADKIALAKQAGLRGAVLFRFDTMNDSKIWGKLR